VDYGRAPYANIHASSGFIFVYYRLDFLRYLERDYTAGILAGYN